ncbi:cell wall anchor protein [Puteibacter caeruleilacunae]|nr:cell wall anchor protein [Puteibacter caeruleilacunae]
MKFLVLGCVLFLLGGKEVLAQTPELRRDASSKYIYIPQQTNNSDFQSVSQLRVGPYITIGDFSYGNHSWIGSNAILTYGSCDGNGSKGNKNYFSPVFDDGCAIVTHYNHAHGQIRGYSHKWGGSSQEVDFNSFDLDWILGNTGNYLRTGLGIGMYKASSDFLSVAGNTSIDGTLKAKEVLVKTDVWADYVFKSDYKLQRLEDVDTFIKENKHLPGLPNESEVKENGFSVSEMNVKLLEKIEELTLYMINQDKMNKQQTELLEKVIEENKILKERINEISRK